MAYFGTFDAGYRGIFAKDKLAPLTFRDTERPIPTSPVAKKVVSDSAKAKGAAKVNENGEYGQGFIFSKAVSADLLPAVHGLASSWRAELI